MELAGSHFLANAVSGRVKHIKQPLCLVGMCASALRTLFLVNGLVNGLKFNSEHLHAALWPNEDRGCMRDARRSLIAVNMPEPVLKGVMSNCCLTSAIAGMVSTSN